MKRWFALLALVVLLAACGGRAAQAGPALSGTEGPAVSRSEGPAATATPTATFTPTPTATFTPTATPTFTPTPTPTVSLPVSLGTPLPPLEPIEGRWDEVQLVARWVAPYPVAWMDDNGYRVFVYGDRVELALPDQKHPISVPISIAVPPEGLWGKLSVGDNRLALVEAKQVVVYDWQGQPVRRISLENADGQFGVQVALSPDGKLVAYAYQEQSNQANWKLSLWFYVVDVDSGEVKFRQHGQYPWFSPDGKRLAVYFDQRVHVYDVNTGKETYAVWAGEASSYDLSQNGSRLALYDKGQGVVLVYDQGKAIRSIHWRQWSSEKPGYAFVYLSPNGAKVLVTSKDAKGWQQALFVVDTGKQASLPKDCSFAGWQGDEMKCGPSVKSIYWSPEMNYLWAKNGGWEFGDLTAQYCRATAETYECSWNTPPQDIAPPGFRPTDLNITVRWWLPGQVLWTHTDFPFQSTVTIFREDGKQIWEGNFPDDRWQDGRSQTGAALSPDRSLLALVGVDDNPYWLYGKPLEVMVKYLVLKPGVQRPPAIKFQTAHVEASWRNAAITFCGTQFLVVTVPGTPVQVYQIATGEKVAEWPSPSAALMVGAACTDKTLVLLDENGTLWLYGLTKQGATR